MEADELIGNFNYVAKVFNLGPSGDLRLTITEQKITVSILFDLELLTASLQKLKLHNDG